MNKKLLFVVPLFAICLTSCGKSNHYEYTDYEINLDWKNDTFKVLTLGDIHFSQTDVYDLHFRFMDLTIEEANPDLIVLNGDAFTLADKKVVKTLFDYFESKNIPWTFVFGNHDDQGYYADNYIQRLLGGNRKWERDYKNVKFINLENDDVTGRSNFFINLNKEGDLKYQIYLFDSHSYNFEDLAYDFLKQDQIDWYKRMIEDTNKKINPSWTVGSEYTIKSSMFMHIPIYKYREVIDEHIANGGEGIQEPTLVSAPIREDGVYDAIKEYNSTLSITASHDHDNDAVMEHEGVYFTFGVHATNRIYYLDTMLGGQVMEIKLDENDKGYVDETSFTNIYHSYKEVM